MSELFCSVKYSIHSIMYEDPEKWITQIEGKVFSYEEDNEILIARSKYFYIDLISAINEGDYPDYILDLKSETAPFIEALYGINSSGFNNHVCKLLNYDNWSPDLFIIDRIEILPQYRGEGLTKKLINEAVRLFSARADVMALKSFPLQFEAKGPNHNPEEWEQKMKLNELEQDTVKADHSLTSHYKKLGFKCLRDENIMVKLIGE